jgi:uncharacterized protein (TIGR03437 family)
MKSRLPLLLQTAAFAVVLVLGARPMAAQCDSACNTFITSVNNAIQPWLSQTPATPVVYSSQLVFANGVVAANAPLNVMLSYIDGLKAAGVQRIDVNPSWTSINDPATAAKYDAVIHHIRELGLQISMNPEVNTLELGKDATFQDYENTAMQTFPAMAARWHPDTFVIIHEPTTMDARMGDVQTTVADWDGLIRAVAPLIKQVSPHTRLGAGGFQNGAVPDLSSQEDAYWRDFVTIPDLGVMTMDIYNIDTFSTYSQWAQLAHANNKAVYIEETWAPAYLPSPLPATDFSPLGFLKASLDDLAIMGAADPAFAQMDINWLKAIAVFAAQNGMEAITPFTTQTFFAYGSSGHDKATDSTYSSTAETAILSPNPSQPLTQTGQAYQSDSYQFGIKVATSINSASFATLPTAFDPTCGSANNPCNANTTLAPDSLVTTFGVNLATTTMLDGTFPTKLGGTSVTLVDSSNTTISAPILSVSPTQVSYYLPPTVKAGPVTVMVTSGGGTQTTGVILVEPVMPGIFTANESGQGVPAAIAVCAGTCAGWPGTKNASGQFSQNVFTSGCTPGNCDPQPISVAAGDTVVVELFGTGLRHLSGLSTISAQLNGQNVPVQYAGMAPGYTGEDQVNLQIPPGMSGTNLNLVLTVNDAVNNVNTTSNSVTLSIQ